MSMTKYGDGGQAFPCEQTIRDTSKHLVKGMSLRDYFAAQALAGMFANDAMITRYGAHAKANLIEPDVLAATAAYSIADAMLSERSK